MWPARRAGTNASVYIKLKIQLKCMPNFDAVVRDIHAGNQGSILMESSFIFSLFKNAFQPLDFSINILLENLGISIFCSF